MLEYYDQINIKGFGCNSNFLVKNNRMLFRRFSNIRIHSEFPSDFLEYLSAYTISELQYQI